MLEEEVWSSGCRAGDDDAAGGWITFSRGQRHCLIRPGSLLVSRVSRRGAVYLLQVSCCCCDDRRAACVRYVVKVGE